MSKQDNLTDFLTDVADAIREKKGTTEKINPQNFSSEILSIEGGGGKPEAWVEPTEKDFNFFDYDGTLLYSYSAEEALALTEMPTPPYTHRGLVFVGWNYTLEDMRSQVDCADIGAMYTTDNGSHRLHIIDNGAGVTLGFTGTDIRIDWGDGSSQTSSSSTLHHDYNGYIGEKYAIELYGVVTISEVSDCQLIEFNVGEKSVNISKSLPPYCSMKISTNTHLMISGTRLQNIYLPFFTVCQAAPQNFLHTSSIKRVSFPARCAAMNTMLYMCELLEALTLPSDFIFNNADTSFHSISSKRGLFRLRVSESNTTYDSRENCNCIILTSSNTLYAGSRSSFIPVSVTSVGEYAFNMCSNLTHIEFPNGLKQIGRNAFYETELTEIILPDTVEYVGTEAFYHTQATYIRMSKSLTNIVAKSFIYSYEAKVIDFRSSDDVPSLENINAFQGIPATCKIVVPDNLYDTWKSATNWSTYASRIAKASEYVEPATE